MKTMITEKHTYDIQCFCNSSLDVNSQQHNANETMMTREMKEHNANSLVCDGTPGAALRPNRCC